MWFRMSAAAHALWCLLLCMQCTNVWFWCLLLCMQASESSLAGMQQLVQQQTGMLLDRQHVTIEGEIAHNWCLHRIQITSLASMLLQVLPSIGSMLSVIEAFLKKMKETGQESDFLSALYAAMCSIEDISTRWEPLESTVLQTVVLYIVCAAAANLWVNCHHCSCYADLRFASKLSSRQVACRNVWFTVLEPQAYWWWYYRHA